MCDSVHVLRWSFTGKSWPNNAKVSGNGNRILTVTGVKSKNQGQYRCHYKYNGTFQISRGFLLVGEFDFTFIKKIVARLQSLF